MVWRPRPVRSSSKELCSHPLRLPSAPPATPPLAANRPLATRENQGNLAPANHGGRFLSGAESRLHASPFLPGLERSVYWVPLPLHLQNETSYFHMLTDDRSAKYFQPKDLDRKYKLINDLDTMLYKR